MRGKRGCDVLFALCLAVSTAAAQQVLIVDQASGTLEEPIVNGNVIPTNVIAQSFTPTFNAVGFVQLRTLIALDPPQGTVALVVHLRAGSHSGPIISSTDPVIIVNNSLLETLYFPENVPITPSQVYFFQPMLQSPGSLSIGYKDPSPYLGGNLWVNGVMSSGDLWFREGMVVPEPCTILLALAGAGVLVCCRLLRIRW